MRLWEWSAKDILAAGPAAAPLAPLADVTEAQLPDVLQSISQMMGREIAEDKFRKLWTATYILLGLKFSDELVDRIITGVEDMAESSTYLKILRQGGIQELKRTIKRQGRIKFGLGEPGREAAIDHIADLETLEALSERILFSNSWEDLLRDIPRNSDDPAAPR